ncbi:hypothetical protein N7468_007949 [Penicillium chermesinum]|uniref:Bacteriophage T5 Orf172 DNA-binding domain-containing protein n=1 Tax=Penicillium chermesinum TaxID=63820 RepID=A0A9W9NNW3_9EURO|nr:uncharacterized protein N7468_007949 [Penicillium chermesinum]KAJ5223407.1 hypothetical protein N7468_007949 [Penicillium chermesinum]KAJ6155754.1 hypothetical protein N7470_006320 [Penicillium chermesinum]
MAASLVQYIAYIFIQLYHGSIWLHHAFVAKEVPCEEDRTPQTNKPTTTSEDLPPPEETHEPGVKSLSAVLCEVTSGTLKLKCAAIQGHMGACQTLMSQEDVGHADRIFKDMLSALRENMYKKENPSKFKLSKLALQLTQSVLCGKHARHKFLYDHVAHGAWIDEIQHEKLKILAELGRLEKEPLEFKPAKTTFKSEDQLDEKVRDKLCSTLRVSDRKTGYIYVISYHRAPGMLKIGTCADGNWEERKYHHMHCYPGFELLDYRRFYYARRLEQTLLAEFKPAERSLKEGCSVCESNSVDGKTRHKEWVEIDLATVKDRLDKWALFFTNPDLYDEQFRYEKGGEWDKLLDGMLSSRPPSKFLTPKKNTVSRSSPRLTGSSSELSSARSSLFSRSSSDSCSSVSLSGSPSLGIPSPGEQSPSPSPRKARGFD